MSIKTFIFFLSLLSAFLLPIPFSFQKNEGDLILFKVEGELTEYSKSQLITIYINYSSSADSVDAKELTQLELFKGGNSYNPKTECFETHTSLNINLVKCYLDLSKISFGKYKIKSFTYKNEQKSSDVTFEIEEITDKKKSEMNLTYFSGEIKEFQENQNFILAFDKTIQVPSRLRRMKIVNEQNKKYSIDIRCSKDDHSTISLNCIGDFPLEPGKYKVIDILFYNGENDFEFINIKKFLTFDVKEDILQLKRVYGEAHNEKFNIMGLIFQDVVYIKYFSKFFIRNKQTNKDYEIDYKFESSITHASADEKIIFDFTNIPTGEYYVNFIYKRHKHINSVVINIKQKENIDSICYDDEGIEN